MLNFLLALVSRNASNISDLEMIRVRLGTEFFVTKVGYLVHQGKMLNVLLALVRRNASNIIFLYSYKVN